MIDIARIVTDRLVLRQWQPGDLDAWAAINADPEVMEYFPGVMSRTESQEWMDLFAGRAEEAGYGFLAVEAEGECIGMTGIVDVRSELPFAPAVEIGWRLARPQWGKGYATEAARAWVDYAFDRLSVDEIVSMTVVDNRRSRAVMERLGMAYVEGGDFDHPALAPGDPLARHVLYRLPAESWPANQ
ncbi:MAG: GNAT family N-acetyltransferase [Acidimicrobiales bacterium]|nr:GNAT family N-acetyltransferase [Acidimicrobiales bacterium]